MSLKLQLRGFQDRVGRWMRGVFREKPDVRVRCSRFLEEATELVQSLGFAREQAHVVVDYVYDRAKGEPYQEVGGVGVCLLAICEAVGIDMSDAFHDEITRINTPEVIARIKARQAEKAAAGL